jgi:predicted nuclease of predicted toxin-antitoxin system
MRLLVNENIPRSVTQRLRANGHDVLSVKESLPGASDSAILARAQMEMRLVITQDKDFGELAFRSGLPAECGIILFRVAGPSPEADCRRMVDAVESRSDWSGHFAVVDDFRIRLRPIGTRKPK